MSVVDLPRYYVSGDDFGSYAEPDAQGAWVKFEDVEQAQEDADEEQRCANAYVAWGTAMTAREQRFGCVWPCISDKCEDECWHDAATTCTAEVVVS